MSSARRSVSPEPRPGDAERVGILGGTFDPIHIGHLLLAEETRLALGLDRVVFIPAGQPWRKAGRPITAAADRVAMVELAIAGNPAFSLSRVEIERRGPSYTAETLGRLRAEWGVGPRLWFILGSDALQDLPNWREPERILAQTRLAVAARDGFDRADLARLDLRVPHLSASVDVVPMPRVAISASELRRRLREGTSVRYWLPEPVEAYAQDRGLYRHTGAQTAAEGGGTHASWVR